MIQSNDCLNRWQSMSTNVCFPFVFNTSLHTISDLFLIFDDRGEGEVCHISMKYIKYVTLVLNLYTNRGPVLPIR